MHFRLKVAYRAGNVSAGIPDTIGLPEHNSRTNFLEEDELSKMNKEDSFVSGSYVWENVLNYHFMNRFVADKYYGSYRYHIISTFRRCSESYYRIASNNSPPSYKSPAANNPPPLTTSKNNSPHPPINSPMWSCLKQYACVPRSNIGGGVIWSHEDWGVCVR